MSGSSGKERADEEEEEGEEPRTLVVRARDGDWIMGDDIVLVVTGEETVVEIQEVHIFCSDFLFAYVRVHPHEVSDYEVPCPDVACFMSIPWKFFASVTRRMVRLASRSCGRQTYRA